VFQHVSQADDRAAAGLVEGREIGRARLDAGRRSRPSGLKPHSWAVKSSEPLPNPTSSQVPSVTKCATRSTMRAEIMRFCSKAAPGCWPGLVRWKISAATSGEK